MDLSLDTRQGCSTMTAVYGERWNCAFEKGTHDLVPAANLEEAPRSMHPDCNLPPSEEQVSPSCFRVSKQGQGGAVWDLVTNLHKPL